MLKKHWKGSRSRASEELEDENIYQFVSTGALGSVV